jgi:peptidoglycan/LPS O-acetylase OafA/YrhL
MKFHRLEAARGFAATYVCVGHLVLANQSHGPLANAFKFGQEAVMVFFVLSGFVICWATSNPNKPREPFRRYFAKRFARIYSVWFMALFAMFAMSSITEGRIVLEPPARLLGNILMLQDFSGAKPNVICVAIYGATPLWSLHYEWWFYMLFPLILLIPNWKIRSHAVGALCVAGSLSYAVLPNPLSRIFLYFGIWWIGAHAASVMRQRNRILLWDVAVPVGYVALASLPMLARCATWFYRGEAMFPGFHPMLETRHLLSSILLVVLAFVWRRLGWIGFRWTIGLCTFVAPISFSLYVVHFNSVVRATYLEFLGSPMIEMAAYIVLTIVFCAFAELIAYPRIRSALVPTPKPGG